MDSSPALIISMIPGDVFTRFANDFASGESYDDIASQLTCDEVDAFTGLLRILNLDEAADAWRAAHEPCGAGEHRKPNEYPCETCGADEGDLCPQPCNPA